MIQIQLYIENDQGVLEEVELYKDESVTLTQSIQDIKDIEKVFTDYSKTFNVPASKINNKFFKHFYNYFIEGFDARKKKRAELHLNYKPFKKGKIKLEGVQLKNNEPHTYKLTFFGNTITLKDLIGEDKLGNLTFLDTFNFVYNDTNISSYLTDGLDGSIGADEILDGIIIPLITHTDRLIYDSSNTDAGTNNVFYSIADTNAHGVKFSQLKPAIRVYAIIKAIEKKYQIEFSTDFFSKTNLAFYNLYMWLHTKEGSLFEDQEAQYTIKNFTNVRGDNTSIEGVHNAYFDNSYNESRFKRTIRVKVTPTTNDQYSVVIKQNGEEFKKFSNLTGVTTNGVTNNIPEIEIPNGDYTFFIEANNAATFSVDITILQIRDTWGGKKEITFTGTAGVLTDQNINISSQLPKMKTLDFLSGIFKMFNLTSYVDDNGKIVVKSLDSFYATSSKTWDITKHLDKEETIVDSVIPYRQVNLGYKGTGTFLAKNHENLNNKKWGTLEYAASEKFEGDAYNIELPFEHMKFERLYDVDTGTETGIQWGWSVDTKQDSTIGEPLLFYATKPIATIAAVNIAGSRVNIVSPWVPSNSLSLLNLFGSQSQSLNFHSEFDEYSRIPNETTLFETYYKGYIKDLFDVRKRLTFVSAYLPISVTENLSLADKIIVFNKLYRINKVTTNFETNKSELELINLLEEKVFAINPLTVPVDISSDSITADTTSYTADLGNILADGFTLPPETIQVPEIIPSNTITQTTTEPCVVTAAIIESTRAESYCDHLKFYGKILSYGTICDQDNIDEFGFLLSSTQSYLTASNNIDTLKSDSNIQIVSVKKLTGYPSLTVGEKVTTKTGLTDPATWYARFYVRTNTSDLHSFADAISSVFTETTNCGQLVTADTTLVTADNDTILNDMAYDLDNDGQEDPIVEISIRVKYAGAGDSDGYLTQPVLSTIIGNGYSYCDTTQTLQTIYHNGQGDYPIVGDRIKFLQSDNYLGGSSSLPYSNTTNDFGAFALANNNTVVNGQGTISSYFVFKISTAEVVAVFACPNNFCDDSLYTIGGRARDIVGLSQTGAIGIQLLSYAFNRVSEFDATKTQVGTFIGMIYSTSYNALDQGTVNGLIENYINYDETPSNAEIVLIESTNASQYGSSTYWTPEGALDNATQTIRKDGLNGTYYARAFIGRCGTVHLFTSIQTVIAS